jgi:hypothetical protein
MRSYVVAGVLLASSITGPAAFGQQQTSPATDVRSSVVIAADQDPQAADQRSWMAVPLVSSNPKLGTSVGGLGAYVTMFDPASRVSIFGVMYQYTSTDSSIGGIIARTSFGEDHHRISAGAVFGVIKNDYEDYLGTGQPLQTEDDLKSVVGRYLYRVGGDWFGGELPGARRDTGRRPGPRDPRGARVQLGVARRGRDARLAR